MLEILGNIFISVFLSLSPQNGKATVRPTRLVTEAEQRSARAVALKALDEQFLPAATRDPDFYHVKGIELKESRLGEPFLDIILSPTSLDDYANSSEDDPRIFATVLKYCYPVYVTGRSDPIIFMVICRNYNRDRDTVFTDGGELDLCGYIPRGDGTAVSAGALRELYGGRVSFVQFNDTSIQRRVIVDGRTGSLSGRVGILSGEQTDSLTTMQSDARRIKRHVLDYKH